MFDPSVLLEEQEKYPIVVKIEDKIDIRSDMKYLYKFEELLKEKKGKTKEEEAEELERKNNNLEKKMLLLKLKEKILLYLMIMLLLRKILKGKLWKNLELKICL